MQFFSFSNHNKYRFDFLIRSGYFLKVNKREIQISCSSKSKNQNTKYALQTANENEKDETSAVTVKETRMDFYQATPPEKCQLHKFGVTYVF